MSRTRLLLLRGTCVALIGIAGLTGRAKATAEPCGPQMVGPLANCDSIPGWVYTQCWNQCQTTVGCVLCGPPGCAEWGWYASCDAIH